VAKGVLTAYKDRLELTTVEKEIISEISLVDIPGHTPGHAGFRVDSGHESLLHLGDIMHLQNLQLINPNVLTIFDIDYETALTSRKRILDMVSADDNLCTSGHWLTPKFGHIERHGSGYAMIS
jgi:glyoxylase-like metal-dependent hydrolase (beta-lactamase superfamily II)